MDHLGSVSEPSAAANAQPAREALAELLQTLVAASEAHACGGQLLPFARACAAPPCLPRIVVGTSEAALPLNLPLTDAHRAMLISSAGRSGVGKSTSTVPVVDLSVRKTWELLPHEFLITNSASWRAGVLDPLLLHIKEELECNEWIVDAELYKLLLYEARAQIDARMHAHALARSHTHTSAQARTLSRTRMYADTHAHTPTRTNSHSNSHTRISLRTKSN